MAVKIGFSFSYHYTLMFINKGKDVEVQVLFYILRHVD